MSIYPNQMKEHRKMLVEFLKNGKAEIEADGLIPTIDELILRTDDSLVDDDHDCKLSPDDSCDHPSHPQVDDDPNEDR